LDKNVTRIFFPKSNLYHVTAMEKKAIRQGLLSGLTHFKTPRKEFRVVSDDGNQMSIEISQQESDFFGRIITQLHTVHVEYEVNNNG